MTMWENTREFQIIGNAIARNRKTLKNKFQSITGGKTKEVNFV